MESTPSPFRPDLLVDRVALVTGGGTGINFGITRQLGLHGAKVAIMGRRTEVLEAAVASLAKEGITALAVTGDVRNADSCEQVIAKVEQTWGRLDILVNGAAGNFLCPPEALSPNGFKTVIDIDLNGTFNMCRNAFELLKKHHGTIINISSTLQLQGTSMQSHAAAAKAGIDALTITLACDWGPEGIRVVGIAPGPIADTEGMKRLGPKRSEALNQFIPLRRMGHAFEIGFCAVFLASPAAGYITGETLVVDGGQWLWKPPFVPKEVVMSELKKRQP